jgi:hypothetical protein
MAVRTDGTGGAPAPIPRPRRFDARAVSNACLAALALGYGALGWVRGGQAIDHHIDLRTVALMRHGSGYYAAMNHAMHEVGHAPVDEVRAFRMPTIFLLWRGLPGDHTIYLLFVACVIATAVLASRLTRFRLVPPALALLLLATGKLRSGSGWVDQFAVVELWVALPSVAALVAWRRERRALAAWMAFAAFAVRELAGGMLLLGLVAALRDRRARAHWIAASALGAAYYGAHSLLAAPYLVTHGTGVELPLLGTGGAGAAVTMMGFALPLGVVLGPVLWSAAVVQCCRRREVLALGLLAVPLSGVLIARPYWGLVSLPAVVVFGTEGLADLVARIRRGRGARSADDQRAAQSELPASAYHSPSVVRSALQ